MLKSQHSGAELSALRSGLSSGRVWLDPFSTRVVSFLFFSPSVIQCLTGRRATEKQNTHDALTGRVFRPSKHRFPQEAIDTIRSITTLANRPDNE
jgi:hypothetical protein